MYAGGEFYDDEFYSGPILWDADPDVCCPAFQTGACPHTEAAAAEAQAQEEEGQ